jgi:transcriptional regulator with XRE-family HTH domain
MQFSAFIKQERTAKGWTMQQLALKAGFLPGYISLVESGRKNPRIGNALCLARALSLDVGELAKVKERFVIHGAAKQKPRRKSKGKGKSKSKSKRKGKASRAKKR